MDSSQQIYARGDRVPEDGTYVCVPCGYTHRYIQGEIFGECVSCLAGSEQAREGFTKGNEMWEKKRSKDNT